MKTLTQFFLRILLLSAILISCKNSNSQKEGQLVTFDLKELPDQTSLKLSDLGATDIRYIPLETNEQSVIPRISKIIISKNYILTQSFANINMFRHDGSFVTKIGTIGRGPDEFTVAHDVDINLKDESIYLVDGWQQRFFVFSKSGDLVRKFKSPLSAAINFRFTKDGILSYNQNHMGNIENSFNLFDTTGNIIKNFPNKYPWKRTVPNVAFQGENIFYRFNNQLFKKEIYCDTIYVYKDKDFKPHIIINVGNLRLSPGIRTESTAEFIMHNFLAPINLFEFGDYIYYEFIVPRNGKSEGLSFIGSKNGNFRVLFDPEKDLINDLDGGPCIWPKTNWDDKTLISWVDAISLKTMVASEAFKSSTPKYPEKKKELEKLANSLNETDNPVLILVTLKK
jgi:6-bladed beta-propeller